MADQSADDYLRHAEHNEKYADFLIADVLPKRSNFSDWAMVVLFYAALHYTKAAILHRHSCVSDQHKGHVDERDVHHPGHEDYVRMFMPSGITALYTDLFQMGWDARYEDFFRQPDASFAEVKRQRENLRKIEAKCREFLAQPPVPP